jgi:clan AA aspartic protease
MDPEKTPLPAVPAPPATGQTAQVLSIVLDHLIQGLVVVGPDFRLLAFNRKFEELFRLPPGTIRIGGDYRDILRVWAAATGQDEAMLERAIRELELPTPFEFEFPQMIHGEPRWCLLTHSPLPTGGCVRTFNDITDRKRISSELEENVRHLKQALDEVHELRGILPICMYCKKVRDDENYWSQIDLYLAKHAGARFSHGICPECLKTYFPDHCEHEAPSPENETNSREPADIGIARAKVRLGNPKRPDLPPLETEALAGTGSLFLCIPESARAQLQLESTSQKEIAIADGKRLICPYVGPIRVTFENRECYTGAVVLGDDVLLGAGTLDDMDLIVLPSGRRVIVNPQHPHFASGPVKGLNTPS